MAKDNVQRVLLQWEVDQAALKRTLAGNSAVSKSVEDVGKQQTQLQSTSKLLQAEFDKVGRARQMDALALNFAKGQTNAEGLVRALKGLGASETEIASLVRQASLLNDELDRASNNNPANRSVGQRITAAGRSLFNAPDIGGVSTPAARGLIAGGAILDKLGASAAQLAIAGPIAAGGLVALAVAAAAFSESLDGSKRVLTGAIGASDAYYKALRDNTTLQSQVQQAEAARSARFLQQQLDELKAARDSAFDQSTGAFTDAGARILDRLGFSSGQQLTERIDELEVEFASASQTAVRLGQGIQQNVFAENDRIAALRSGVTEIQKAAAAERQLEEQRIRSFMSFNQEVLGMQRAAATSLIGGSIVAEGADAQALTERLRALDDERQALQRNLPYLEQRAALDAESAKTFQDTTNRLRDLNIEFQRLNQDVSPAALRRLSDELGAEILDINTKSQARIAELEQARTDAETKAREQRDAAEIEATEKRGDALAKLAEDQADKRLKIERDYNRTSQSAVANRDALAFYEAKIKRADDLADLKADGARRTKELDKQLADQQKVITKRYDEQLKTARTTAERAIATERARATAEIRTRNQAAEIILSNLRLALNAETAIRNAANDAHVIGAQQLYNRLQQIYGASGIVVPNSVYLPPVQSQQQAYQQFVNYQRSQGIPGFETGLNRVPRDNFLARLHRDEAVLNRNEARMWREGKANGATVSVQIGTIRATNRRDIHKEVYRVLDAELAAAGIPG